MRYFGVVVGLLLLSFPAFSADMTAEERCQKLGEVAEKASSMRISGEDKDATTSALLKTYDHPESGLTTDKIRGMVMVSYMARMEPEKMQDFAIAECRKDIPRR